MHIDCQPSETLLKRFGLYGSGLALLAAVVTVVRSVDTARSSKVLVLLALAVITGAAGLIRPRYLKPLYLALTIATWPIRWCLSWVAVTLLFFLIITPFALVFRWIGRDELRRRFRRPATTFWIRRPPPPPARSYLREF